MNDIIIIFPTLNEKQNIEILLNKLITINISFDLLFVDDNSSDGSQETIKDLAKNNQNINYIFRPQKMGVGSAHKDGFIWAYQKNYKTIVTMDADGTHDPKYLKLLIEKLKNFDIVITNRFLEKNLLSGAFRIIDCKKISLSDLILAKNNGYAYFWESIFILHRKKYLIREIPIHLPYRIVGSSKMVLKDIFVSLAYLMVVFFKKILGNYNYK